MESTARPEVPDLEVLVHRFSWCFCGSEIHSAGHIKLRTFKRPVKSGKAVALSYGLGDFDRQKHIFGHVDGLESELVTLEFGGEWEIEGLASAMVALSKKHGAVWLDQLSIPQDQASIKLHLPDMPRIYSSFEVVILLPNSPCSCLKDAFDSWNSTGSQSRSDGDFHIDGTSAKCLNAFPVSSYHFRLWTKQEFSYARTISIHYCGAPGKCLRRKFDWDFRWLETLTKRSGHLTRWASWKYASCYGVASNQSGHTSAVAYSTFMAAQNDGEAHLQTALHTFFLRKDPYQVRRIGCARLAGFLLGKKLHRKRHHFENIFNPSDLRSEHVATSQKDLALAVLPAANGYRLPQYHARMTLPELIEDGIEQCQRYHERCYKTKLPRGLFDDGIGSMGPVPSLYLRIENMKCLRDVYGSLLTGLFPGALHSGITWITTLYLRDATPRPSRLALSKTYAEAFGSASTAEVCEYMGKLPLRSISNSRSWAYNEWAKAVYYGDIPAPVNGWPSPAHEQAMFEELMAQERPWGSSWPEIDHEMACYNIMCDYVCINPDVAREKGLGLVVKTSDPPCIGFVNSVVYDKIRATEQFLHAHGVSAPEAWRTNNGIAPEDWLTLTLDTTEGDPHQTLEVVKSTTRFGFPERIDNIGRRYKESVPSYIVRGVWYVCQKDDPCIGADLAESSAGDYDAILI